jgi:hypothetical protein
MWDESVSIIKSELGPAETLLWTGRPRGGLTFRSSDLVTIPFSILWCGFALFWEGSVLVRNAPLLFKLWGIPFVAVGLYMVIGRFFLDAYQRSKTFYGVTSERVIIITNTFSRSIKSLNIRMLPTVTLKQKSDGKGSIILGHSTDDDNSLAWGKSRNRRPDPPSLELIPDARKVYEIIRDVQRKGQK